MKQINIKKLSFLIVFGLTLVFLCSISGEKITFKSSVIWGPGADYGFQEGGKESNNLEVTQDGYVEFRSGKEDGSSLLSDKEGIYESVWHTVDDDISSLVVNWEFTGQVTLEVSADKGYNYTQIINGVPLSKRFTKGRMLRWKATLQPGSILKRVRVDYQDASGVVTSFGNQDLEGFSYRKVVYLKNTTGQDLFNYQTKVVVAESKAVEDYDVQCNNNIEKDFVDVRFTAADGETSLSYYLQEVTGVLPNRKAVFWVKIPQLPAKYMLPIYIYYGHSQASDLSSGEDVFEFYDGFNAGQLDTSKWQFSEDGVYSLSNNGLSLTGSEIITSDCQVQEGIIEYRAKITAGNELRVSVKSLDEEGQEQAKQTFYSSGYQDAEHAIVKDDTVKINEAKPVELDTIYIYKAEITDNQLTFKRYADGLEELQADISYANDSDPVRGYISLKAVPDNSVYFDWIRVRKQPLEGVSVATELTQKYPAQSITLPEFRGVKVADDGRLVVKEELDKGQYISGEILTPFSSRILVPAWEVSNAGDENFGLFVSFDGGENYSNKCKEHEFIYVSKDDLTTGDELKFIVDLKKTETKEPLLEEIALDYRPGTITIISPSANEKIPGGSSYQIIWSAEEYEEDYPLSLKYTLDSGKTYQIIDETVFNTGVYLWKVPEVLSKCRIKLSDFFSPEDIYDISEGYFSIVAPEDETGQEETEKVSEQESEEKTAQEESKGLAKEQEVKEKVAEEEIKETETEVVQEQVQRRSFGIKARVYNAKTNPDDFYLKDEESKYVPYIFNKVSDKKYEVITRTLEGRQKFVFTPSTVALLEDKGSGFDSKVKNTWFYIQKRGFLPWQWQDVDLAGGKLSYEKNQDGTITIYNTSQLGRLEAKLGFDGKKYYHKFSFKADASKIGGTTRVHWDTAFSDPRAIKQDDHNVTEKKKEKKKWAFGFTSERVVEEEVSEQEIGNVKVGWRDFKKLAPKGGFFQKDESETRAEKLTSTNQDNPHNSSALRVWFYEDGKTGLIDIDPSISGPTPDSEITVQVGAGTTSADFKLIFKESDRGISEFYKGTDFVTNLCSTASLLTELDQDAETQEGQTADSVLTLLENRTDRVTIKNTFSLGSEADVTEYWIIYPTGKIIKKVVYEKLLDGTEVRSVDVDAGISGYHSGSVPDTGRATGTYTNYQIIDLIGSDSAEVTDFQNPISLDPSVGSLDRTLTGDADSDGFNETEGSYEFYPGNSVSEDLVSQWKMDDSAGNTTVTDSVGTNNGALTNAGNTSNASVAGKIDSAINLPGSDDYINVGSIPIGSDWTMGGWFYYPLPSNASWNTLFRGTSYHHIIVQRSNMHLGLYQSGFRDSGFLMSSLSTGWHHVMAVGTGGHQDFYVDGSLVGSRVSYQCTDNLATIGNFTGGGQQFGRVDDIRVYNRSLTASEIARIYNLGYGDGYIGSISSGSSVRFDFDGSSAIKYDPVFKSHQFYPDCTVTLSPVAYWKMNGDWTDYSGSGNNGTAYNGATFETTNQKLGSGAGSFDGVNDYVEFSEINLGPDEEWTVLAWVKTSDATNDSTNRIPVPVLGDSTSGQWLNFGVDNSRAVFMYYDGSNWQKVFGTSNVADGSWNLLTFAGNSDGTVSIYVNGSGENLDFSWSSDTSRTDINSIGAAYERFANAEIDDVRIYDRALTADEISAIYNSGTGTEESRTRTIQYAYYKLDEDTSSTTTLDNSEGTSDKDAAASGDIGTMSGLRNRGINVDSAGENFSVTSANILSDWSKGTIEFWYKPSYAFAEVQSETKYLFGTGASGAASSIWARVYDNITTATLEFGINDGTNSSTVTVTETDQALWVADEWCHLRFVWDDDSAPVCQIYYNGELVSQAPSDASMDMTTVGATLYFGDYQATGVNNANGIFDEVFIYNASIKPYGAFFNDYANAYNNPNSEITFYDGLDSTTSDADISVGLAGRAESGTSNIGAINGDGVSFDALGDNQRFSLLSNIDSGQGSLGLWLKSNETENTSGDDYVFFADSNFNLYYDTSDQLNFRINASTTLTDTDDTYDGKWHWVKVTWDYVDDSYYLYVDGEEKDSSSLACSAPDFSTGSFYIGNNSTASANFSGVIDEIYITSSAYTPEINTANGVPLKMPQLSIDGVIQTTPAVYNCANYFSASDYLVHYLQDVSTDIDIAISPSVGEVDSYTVTNTTPQSVGDGWTETVTAFDSNGNIAITDSETVVTMSSSGSAQFYTDGTYTTTTSTYTLSSGQVTVYVKDDTAETITLTATDGSSNTGTSGDIVLESDSAAQISLTGPDSVEAGSVSTAFTITTQDEFGNTTTVDSDTTFNLSTDTTATGTFYSDEAGASEITGSPPSIVVSSGESSVDFYYKDTRSDALNSTVTATDAAASLGSDTHSVSVTCVLDHYAVTNTTPQSVGDGWTETVTAQNVNDITVTHDSTTVVTMSNSGSAQFYTDGTYAAATSTYTLSSGQVTVYPKDNTAETITVTATTQGGSETGVSSNIALVEDPAAQIVLTGPGSATAGSVSSTPFTITAQDEFGNNTVVSSNTTFNLSSTSGQGLFYTDAGGTNEVTSIGLGSGLGSVNFYYKDTTAASPTVTATDAAASLGSDTHSINVNPAVTAYYSLNSPDDIAAGSSAAYTVTRYDVYDNEATSGVEQVYLYTTSTCAEAKFSATDGGAEITSITIDDGNATANFYYYDELADSNGYTITASDTTPSADGATGITDDTDDITVTPASTSYYSLSSPDDSTVGDSALYTVTRYDVYGNQANSGEETVYLYTTSTDTNAKFSITEGGDSVASRSILVGNNSTDFYYYDETAGDYTITASDATPIDSPDTGITNAQDSITFLASGTIHHYGFSNVTPVDGSGWIEKVTGYDSMDNVITSDSATVVTMSSTGSAEFYTDDTFSSLATNSQYTLSSGAAYVYIKDDSLESFTITADDGAASGTSNAITVEDIFDTLDADTGSVSWKSSYAWSNTANGDYRFAGSASAVDGVYIDHEGKLAYRASPGTFTSKAITAASDVAYLYLRWVSTGTVSMEVSADGGSNWTSVSNGLILNSPDDGDFTTGTSMQWRATLSSGATLSKVVLKYIDAGRRAYSFNARGSVFSDTAVYNKGDLELLLSSGVTTGSYTSNLMPAGFNLSSLTPSISAERAIYKGAYSSEKGDITGIDGDSLGGYYHSCYILRDGSVRCWGSNSDGQLGDGTTTDRSSPVTVQGVQAATDIATGGNHSCAVLDTGQVSCWGDNSHGQLGNNSTTDSSVPVTVSGISTAVDVTAGALHSCALLEDGTVQCWGCNADGQLGNESYTNSQIPVFVTSGGSNLTDVESVVAGGYHTLALLSSGAVKAWGNNDEGSLGNNSTDDSNAPVDVSGIDGSSSSAVDLSGGYYHSCAVLTDGTVSCWGSDAVGQIQGVSGAYDTDSGFAPQLTPEQVTGINGAVEVESGAYHNIALLKDGTVKTWGYNIQGQIGNSTTSDASEPVYLGIGQVAFSSVGSHNWTVPEGVRKVTVLVVAGGGGGGGIIGGGGGAGGLIYETDYSVTAGQDISVVVGAGGSGGTGWNTASQDGKPGGNSSFGSLVAYGGGGGGWYGGATTTGVIDGGSGGGGANGHSSGGSGVSGQGYNGGNGCGSNNAAGGGGAGAVGTSCVNASYSGNGGVGRYLGGAFGTSVGQSGWFAGGGGGGTRASNGSAGTGGTGGGGSGTTSSVKAGNASANTGGGGGGAGYSVTSASVLGGNGGSGIVLIQYTTDNDFIDVTAGFYNSGALLNDGTVSFWGDNNYGQVGDDTTTQRTSPVSQPWSFNTVALYNFNDAATDSSGNGLDLSLQNSPSYSAGKFSSNALRLDGSLSQYGVVTGSSKMDTPNQLTIEAWVQPTAAPSPQAYIVYRHQAYYLRLESDYSVTGGVWNGTGWDTVTSSSTITVDNWQHISFVFDRSASTDQLYIFIDGDLDANSAVYTGTYIDAVSSDLYVGCQYIDPNTQNFFSGYIDELRISGVSRGSLKLDLSADGGSNWSQDVEMGSSSNPGNGESLQYKVWLTSVDNSVRPSLEEIVFSYYGTPIVTDGNVIIEYSLEATPASFSPYDGEELSAGDTVKVIWDNSGTGDGGSNSETVTGCSFDIGGVSSVSMAETSGVWEGTYTFLEEADAEYVAFNGDAYNAEVTATNSHGDTDFTDTTDISIDNTPPSGYGVSIGQSYINLDNQTEASFSFTGAEVGASYSYSFTDQSTGEVAGSGTVAAADQTISGIDLSSLGDGTVNLVVYLTDALGNEDSDGANDFVEKDTVEPTGYSVSIDQPYINDSNQTALSFTFAGAEVGTEYSYSIDDTNAGTTAVTGTGTIATATDQIAGIDVSSLDDDTLTLTVYLTDTAGNEGSDTTDTVEKDATFPSGYSISIDQPYINDSNQTALSFTFAGAEVGTEYSYSIDDTNVGTTAVTGTGTIATATDQIAGIDVSSLDDDTLTLTVYLTDSFNNQGADTTDTVEKDTVAPVFSSVAVSDPDEYYTAGDTVSFDVDLGESGLTVTVDLTVLDTALASDFGLTDDGDGTYSGTTGALAAGTLIEGIDTAVTVTAQDAGGNSTDDSTLTLTVDNTLPSGYSISIDQSYINDNNQTALSFTFAGAEVGTDYSYSIDDTNAGTAAVTGTGAISTATDQIAGIDVSSLDDDTLTLTVYLTDTAGNQGADTEDTVEKDTVAPSGYSISIDQPYINDSNQTALSFTFAGAEVGTNYSYSIDDTNAGTTAVTGTGAISTATDQIAGIDVSSLDDDTLTLTVYLTDTAGNQGADTEDTVEKDTVAPSGYSISIDQSYINENNDGALSFTFAGAEVGTDYSYSIDDTNAGTTAVTGTGTIATATDQIAGIDVSSLDDDTLTLTVYLTDTAGNQGADTEDTVDKDSNPPVFVSAAVSDPDEYYTAGDTVSFDVDLGESGLTVTVDLTVLDTALASDFGLTDDGDGTYSGTTGALAAGTLIEGIDTAVTVTAQDTGGHSTDDSSLTLTVDNTLPSGYSISIDQSYINENNDGALSFTFAGAEVGTNYSYSIDDTNAGTTAVTGTGTIATATDQIAGIDVSSLDDDTLTLTVYLTDTAGNQGADTTDTVEKDTVAPSGYSVSIDQSYINADNQAALSFTFAGAEISTDYSYSIDDTNAGTAAVTGTGAISTATDQITGIDVSSLDDDTLTLTVYLTDSFNNQGADTTDTVEKDTVAPSGYSVSIDQSYINADNQAGLSFTFAGAEISTDYSYSIDDTNAGTTAVTGTGAISTATDQITGIDVSSLVDDTLTLTVYLTDSFNNQGADTTDTVEKDTVAPSGYSVSIDQSYINADNQAALSFTFAGAEISTDYSYSIDDTNAGTAAVTGTGAISTATDQITGIDVSSLDDDTLTLTVYLTDSFNNQGADTTDTVEKDTVAPSGYSVSIDQSYINADNQAGLSFTFAGAEISTDYSYSIDDTNAGTTAVTGTGAISTATDQITGIDVSSLVDDTLTLTVYLTDTAGNQGSDTEDTVEKDTGIPVFVSVAVSDPDEYYTAGDTISFDVDLAEQGLTVTVDLTVLDTALSSSFSLTDDGDGTYSGTTGALAAGTLIEGIDTAVTITAQDSSDNSVDNSSLTLTVDNTAPLGYSVSIDQSYINEDNDGALSFTFAGAEVDTEYSYSIDDTNAGTTAVTGTGTISTATDQITGIDVTDLDDGILTLTVYLTDTAGNQGSDTEDTVEKDTVAPVFSSVAVSDPDEYYTAGDTISFDVDLAEQGLTVTVDLTVLDTALSSSFSLTDDGDGTYSGTTGALAAGTLIEGIDTAVTITAQDSYDHSVDDNSLTLTVDSSAPTAEVTIAEDSYTQSVWDAAQAAGNPVINGTASDAGGLASVDLTISYEDQGGTVYYFDGLGSWTQSQIWLSATDSSAGGDWSTWDYSLSSDNLSASTQYTVTARATDLSNNTTTSGNYGTDSFIYSPIMEIVLSTDLTAGEEADITVSIQDSLDNAVAGYRGTVTFSCSTDSNENVSLPLDYTFTSEDAGSHTFGPSTGETGVTLITAGTGHTVTVADTSDSSLTDSQEDIVVKHAAADYLEFASDIDDGTGTPDDATDDLAAGTEFNLPVLRAYDTYGNLADGANDASGYTGTKTINYTLSGTANAPDGTPTDDWTTSVEFSEGVSTTDLATTLYRAQDTTITADAQDLSGANAVSNQVTIKPDAGAKLVYIQEPSTMSLINTSLVQNPIVEVRDAYGNRTAGTDAITLSAITGLDVNGDPVYTEGTVSADSNPLNATAGRAAFTNVQYNLAASVYLYASGEGLEGAASRAVNFTSNSTSRIFGADSPIRTFALTSTADTLEEKIDVLRFRILDMGGDSTPTLVDRLQIDVAGTGGDASNDIAWAGLYVGGSLVSEGTITDSTIVFGSTANSNSTAELYSVADLSATSFTVSVYMNTTINAEEGSIYTFDTTEANIGVDTGSSGMVENSNTDLLSTGTLVITGTHLRVLSSEGQSSLTMTAGSTAEVNVALTDANGNIDTDYAGVAKNYIFSGLDSIGDYSPNVEGEDLGNSISAAVAEGVTTSTLTLQAFEKGTDTLYARDALASYINVPLSVEVLSAEGSSVSISSGNNQSAPINAAVSNSLTATVYDIYGNPASGQAVTFSIASQPTSASASLSAASVTSDDDGAVSTVITLGDVAGTYQVYLTGTNSSGDTLTGAPITFTATAQPPGALVVVSGNSQTATVSSTVDTYVVKLTTEDGDPVPGETITFRLSSRPQGAIGFALSAKSDVTDAQGRAEVTLTLGNIIGDYVVTATYGSYSVDLTATAQALESDTTEPDSDTSSSPSSSLDYNDTSTVSSTISDADDDIPPESLSAVSGEDQNVYVTETTEPLVVELVTEYGTFMTGETVRFNIVSYPKCDEVKPSLSADKDITNSDGQAQSTLTLGDAVGQYVVRASYSSYSIEFTVNGKSKALDRMVLSGPSSVLVNEVSRAFTIQIKDSRGNPSALAKTTKFSLSSSGSQGGNFYSDKAGTKEINSLTIMSGSSSGTFYYKNAMIGTVIIQAKKVLGQKLAVEQDRIENFNVIAGVIGHFSVTGSTDSIIAGDSRKVTVIAHDQDGSVKANYTGDMAVKFQGALGTDLPLLKSPTATNKEGNDVDFGMETTLEFNQGIANSMVKLYKSEIVSIKVVAVDTQGLQISTPDDNDLDVKVLHGPADHLRFAQTSITDQKVAEDDDIWFVLPNLYVVDKYDNTCNGNYYPDISKAAFNEEDKEVVWYIVDAEGVELESSVPNQSVPANNLVYANFQNGVASGVSIKLYRSYPGKVYLKARTEGLTGERDNVSSKGFIVEPGQLSMIRFPDDLEDDCITSQYIKTKQDQEVPEVEIAIADKFGNPILQDSKQATIILSAYVLTDSQANLYEPVENGTLKADRLSINTHKGIAKFNNVTYDYPETIYLRASLSPDAEVQLKPAYSSPVDFRTAQEATIEKISLPLPVDLESEEPGYNKIDVFKFAIADGGEDKKDIKILQLVVRNGNPQLGWKDHIQQAYLYDGVNKVLGVVNDDRITFGPGDRVVFNIPDGHKGKNFVLSIVVEGKVPEIFINGGLIFRIDAVKDIGLVSPDSSQFSPDESVQEIVGKEDEPEITSAEEQTQEGQASGDGSYKGIEIELDNISDSLLKIRRQVKEKGMDKLVEDNVAAIYGRLGNIGKQIIQLNQSSTGGMDRGELAELYSIDEAKAKDINYLINKAEQFKSLLELNKKISVDVEEKPVTQIWFEFR